MSSEPRGIDAHELLIERSVAKALYELTLSLLSNASVYLSPTSAGSASGSTADTTAPSLMVVTGKVWVLAPLPADLSFLLRTDQEPPKLPQIAIVGFQKLYAELRKLEGEKKAQEFLTDFYHKTTQMDDSWVSFSVGKDLYKLSLLDIFSVVSLAVETMHTEAASALGAGAGAGAGAGFGLSPETFAGTASAAGAGSGSSSTMTDPSESAEQPWTKLTSYLFMDIGINSACSARYRDLMMIGLRHIDHPAARSIFPGAISVIKEGLFECQRSLLPTFQSEPTAYTTGLHNFLSEGEGSYWIQILSALVDDEKIEKIPLEAPQLRSHFSFRQYFEHQFLPDFLKRQGFDLTVLDEIGSSISREIHTTLNSEFPNETEASEYQLLDGLRWTDSPKDPGYFLESLISQVGSFSPSAGILLAELSRLNAEQPDPIHRDLGTNLAKLDRLAEQLLSLHQLRKALHASGYSNPKNPTAFDESEKKFIDDTAPLFTGRDESLRIKDLEKLLSSISDDEKAMKALLDEHESSSHAAILNVFALLFHRHPEPLVDRLQYLHKSVLSRPSPVSEPWLARYRETRECFAKEVNQLVLYALTHSIHEWSPVLVECLNRTFMTFSQMDSLENYARSLELDLPTLDDSRKRELENQIAFVKHSYPQKFQDLLKGLVADYQTLHPATGETESMVAMAEAATPSITTIPTESPAFALGLHRLYNQLYPDFLEILNSLKLAEVSAEEIFSFVKTNLTKIQNGHDLGAVISALGGKDMALLHQALLLRDSTFEKIGTSDELLWVIDSLDGKHMEPDITEKLLTESILAKIENGSQLEKVIEALGGKEMKPDIAGKLFTKSILERFPKSAPPAKASIALTFFERTAPAAGAGTGPSASHE
jgi:hypothetical protein